MTKWCTTTKGHKKSEEERCFCRYSVYRNNDDMPIIIDGTAKECAAAMGVDIKSFYRTVSRSYKGRSMRHTVIRRMLDENEGEDE